MSSNPHDALFREIFRRPEHARGALRAILPPAVSEALDWNSLAPSPGSFIDPELVDSHTDLLFSLPWRAGGRALVYVLYEHQSSPDRRMPFRLLRYLVRIWERWFTDHPRVETLPVILPIVAYHGESAWPAPLTFDAMFELPEPPRSALAPHLVRFTYVVDRISEVADDQLRARSMSALGTLAMLCLKHARTEPDLLRRFATWIDLVREVTLAPSGIDAFKLVVRYILEVNRDIDISQLGELVDRTVSTDAGNAVMTTGQQLRQEGIREGRQEGIREGRQEGIREGRQEGIREGRQEGIREGRQEGERGILLRQLRARFGSQVDAAVEQRVAAASSQQLLVWADRVLSAHSLAELLAE